MGSLRVAKIESTRTPRAYIAFAKRVRAKYPNAFIVCIDATNSGTADIAKVVTATNGGGAYPLHASAPRLAQTATRANGLWTRTSGPGNRNYPFAMKTQPFADDDYHYRVPKNHAVGGTMAVLLLSACAIAAVAYVIDRSPPVTSRLKSLIGAPAMTTSDAATRPAFESVGGRDRSPLRAEQTKTDPEAPIATPSGLASTRELTTTTSQRPVFPRANVKQPRGARVTAAASEANVDEHVGRPRK